MAVKASATITIFNVDDIAGTTRYYKSVASGSSAPSKPAENSDPDSTWKTTEPTVDTSKVLYFVDQTLWSNGAKTYSEVSKSSSYEAAKEAYTKAQNAQNTAQSAQDDIDNLEVGGRNLFANSLQTTHYLYSDADYISINLTGWGTSQTLVTNVDWNAHVINEIVLSMYLKPTIINGGGSICAGFQVFYIDGTFTQYLGGIDWANNNEGYVVGEEGYCKLNCAIPEGKTIDYINVVIRNSISTQTATVEYREIKLEAGNKATSWSPAPEDVDADINEAAKTATNYLKFNNGLIVAKDAANWESGNNVFIDDDSVDIRVGERVLASYGDSIQLYDKQSNRKLFEIKRENILDTVTQGISVNVRSNYPPPSPIGVSIREVSLPKGLFLLILRFSNSKKNYILCDAPRVVSNEHIQWKSSEKNVLMIGSDKYPVTYIDPNGDATQTINGNLWIENTGYANGKAYPLAPFGIGTKEGEHLEVDCSEIMAKSDAYTPSHLYMNREGGDVSINNNCDRGFLFQNGIMFVKNEGFNSTTTRLCNVVDGSSESGNTTFAFGNWLWETGITKLYGNEIRLVTRNLPISVTGTTGYDEDISNKVMLSKLLNSYYGLVNPDGSDESYIRSPKQGIIPYASGGNASHGLATTIGTETWPFYSGYFEYLNATNWIKVGGTKVSLEGHSHSWSAIIDKPSSYPPEGHAHAWSAITDKPSSYPPERHTHSNYSETGHTHSKLAGGKDNVILTGAFFRPSSTNGTITLGGASYRWNAVYAKTGTINTSDLRQKHSLETDMEKYIAMLDKIEPTSYVLNDDETESRHVGYIAQKVRLAMKESGLEESDFAGFIRDMQDEGPVYTYGLIYSEFIPILHAKIKQQEKRINELEAKLDAILEKLGEQ